MNSVYSMHNIVSVLVAGIMLICISGCEQERTSGRGLYLPEGNIEEGKLAFAELGCMQCHTVKNTDLTALAGESLVLLELGGKVRRVRSYGELITSIMNPDHIISPEFLKKISPAEAGVYQETGEATSPMPAFNDKMTVTQLIDIITFLDSRYEKEIPEYIGYGIQYIQH